MCYRFVYLVSVLMVGVSIDQLGSDLRTRHALCRRALGLVGAFGARASDVVHALALDLHGRFKV